MSEPISTRVRSRVAGAPRWALGVHIVMVLAAAGCYLGLDFATRGQPAAAIGASLSAIPIVLLGLPWSVLLFVWDPTDGGVHAAPMALVAYYTVRVGPAVPNVVLHALLRRRPPPEPNRRPERTRARRTVTRAATVCLFWVATDLVGHHLGWATVIAIAVSIGFVLLLQGGLVWVDRIDARERAANTHTGHTPPPNPPPTVRTTDDDQ